MYSTVQSHQVRLFLLYQNLTEKRTSNLSHLNPNQTPVYRYCAVQSQRYISIHLNPRPLHIKVVVCSGAGDAAPLVDQVDAIEARNVGGKVGGTEAKTVSPNEQQTRCRKQ